MRLLKDTLIALMLVAILTMVLWHNQDEREHRDEIGAVRLSVQAIQSEVLLQSALANVELSERGYPATIDPEWFDRPLPNNKLLSNSHPWVEIAGPRQRNLRHPPDRIATDGSLAKFWYNPSTGVVRARVPSSVSDAAALKLYNAINDTDLTAIFVTSANEAPEM